jgi:transcription initiation factor TFIIIB Brf1 subunit/transcription initiation factor TFIIB
MLLYYYVWLLFALAYRRKRLRIERRIKIRELRGQNLYELISESDKMCLSQLRMDRRTFSILCEMVRDVGGLEGSRNMSLEEIVASFLYILSHHFKNRTVGIFFTGAQNQLVEISMHAF